MFYKCNIANKISLKKFSKHKFDIVINLAAQAGVRYSIENPDAYIESNLLGFFNILNFSKCIKLVIFYMQAQVVFMVQIKNYHLAKRTM